MEIEIVSKKENQLLERTEVMFKATHSKEGTPQRDAVRDKIASLLKVPKDRVVVDSMKSEFGRMETVGYAKAYKSKEAAMKFEREHILIRNKLKEKAAPAKKGASPAPAEAGAAVAEKE
jgi:small subunit ribosomal protein S24e